MLCVQGCGPHFPILLPLSSGSLSPGEYCVKGVTGETSVHLWLDSEGEPWEGDSSVTRKTQEGQK